MDTLKVQLADETREFNKEQFDSLMDELFGKENKMIHTVNKYHPFMRDLFTSKTSLFKDLQMIMRTPAKEIEIMDNDITILIIKK